MIAEKCDQAQGNAAFVAACGAGGNSVAAAASAAATSSSSRSGSWRTAASAGSTAPSSFDGEQQRQQEEEEEVKLDSSDVRHSKASTVRRTSISAVSLSLMSSMGWRGRSGSQSQSERAAAV
jgi:hypothetical protein